MRQGELLLDLQDHVEAVKARLTAWEAGNFGGRLLAGDPTIWSGNPDHEITNRLGWLELPEKSPGQLDDIISFADQLRSGGFRHVVLMGMGGSSLAPKVFQRTFGNSVDHPELITVDTPHPGAVRDVSTRIEPGETLFAVASKSGRTIEPLTLFRYFWREAGRRVGEPGDNFIAITDAGTPLEDLAKEKVFRKTFFAEPNLGGRYSALTAYGLVPAALIGVDVGKLLERAGTAVKSVSTAISLGAALGELALRGRDKLTFFASPSVAHFPVWLEQLIAESTGKDGRGILPVVNEPAIDPSRYGNDRLFAILRIDGEEVPGASDDFLARLGAEGHPVATVSLSDAYDIGREIFRWEVAVASAGAIIGINPFNQPDVELSKRLSRRAMDSGGKEELEAGDITTGSGELLRERLDEWLGDAEEGDYISIHAYLQPSKSTSDLLGQARQALLFRTSLATTMDYGPQFLHSTGQLHKGGPGTGLYLQIVDGTDEELWVPGEPHSFNDLIRAQSIGDFFALKRRGRRILRVNLEGDVERGLITLEAALAQHPGS